MKRIVFKSKLFLVPSFLTLIIFWSCDKKLDPVNTEMESSSIKNLNGQLVPLDSIEAFLDHKMQEMNIPGLSMAIINDGQVVYHTAKGYAELESQTPVIDKTLFEGASTSKALFAYLSMFLVEEGLLDLDRPLYEYLDPKLRDNYDYDERYRQITARMVLAHTTGFPNWRGNDELTIQFEPGTNFSYSGEGYQFLVKSIESILDTDYMGLEAYYQNKVAKPFNMEYTKFVQNQYNIQHKATPYNQGAPLEINPWDAKEFNAASAIHTEAIDFSKWLIAIMNQQGISRESYQLLFSDQITVEEAPTLLSEEGAIAWTLGFAKYQRAGQIVYGHEGNNDGFNALFLIDLDKKWGFVQFNNANEVYDFGFDVFNYLTLYD